MTLATNLAPLLDPASLPTSQALDDLLAPDGSTDYRLMMDLLAVMLRNLTERGLTDLACEFAKKLIWSLIEPHGYYTVTPRILREYVVSIVGELADIDPIAADDEDASAEVSKISLARVNVFEAIRIALPEHARSTLEAHLKFAEGVAFKMERPKGLDLTLEYSTNRRTPKTNRELKLHERFPHSTGRKFGEEVTHGYISTGLLGTTTAPTKTPEELEVAQDGFIVRPHEETAKRESPQVLYVHGIANSFLDALRRVIQVRSLLEQTVDFFLVANKARKHLERHERSACV